MELIFHYGDVFKKYADGNCAHIQPRSFIHGQLKNFIEVEATGKIGVFSIRFMPNGLYPFLQQNIDGLTENEITVYELFGREGSYLEEKMMEAPSTISRIKIIEDHLLRWLKPDAPNYTVIDYCVRSIYNSSGAKSIENLSEETGMRRRHLERQFKTTVGISPKLLSRIVRFQHTLQRIERDPTNSLTGIAYANGFFDQSHFIKDFKEFTGLNPKHYFDSHLDLAKYLAS